MVSRSRFSRPRRHLLRSALLAALAIPALAGAAVGLILSDRLVLGESQVRYPAFTAWTAKSGSLVPMLFITIACGAISGFHSLVASGTTPKLITNEQDARLIGYGSPEGFIEGRLTAAVRRHMAAA